MTKQQLEQYNREIVAEAATQFAANTFLGDHRAVVLTKHVTNPFFAKCSISTDRTSLHPSLRRGPDAKEIEGRKMASQPRDFDDIFATIDHRRFYFHPDRPSVHRVDQLAAGLDTDLDDAIRVAKKVTKKDTDHPLYDVNVPIAYMRTTRRDGMQTIVNIGGITNATGTKVDVRRLVTVSRGYSAPCEVHYIRPLEAVRIHVLLAYSNRPHRLAAFLKMFALYFEHSNSNLVRIVVSTTPHELEDVTRTASAHQVLNEMRLIVITSRGDDHGSFSRAVAMREAARTVPNDDIIFFSDADLVIGGNFLQNCRFNVIKGSQVWFPVMFSLYPYGKSLSSHDGIWRRSSYGMACMYKHDFEEVGGFGGNEERAFTGWGAEDVFLYNRFRDNDRYAVLRTLEPGLQHQWHGKNCEKNESYENCMRTVYMTIGSQEAVAKLMAAAKVDISSLTKNAKPV